ncbi:GNAT family N-acetyltransferase [Streptomyces sp. SID3343]|uniref:GNAT family N-acetyltransferase n=1 Tax=Streptomyces sp. SID3343 TaxID=2690260 RepID=UPI001370B4F5|nr:GNAT family N-acetyltransferase [Streptomyces sp. SID3343]MYV97450.1 GNAT family N-acetyltransferase [Streptomyces sp. SID3343]
MDDLVTARLVLHPMTVDDALRVMAREPAADARWAPGYPDAGDVTGANRFVSTCAAVGDPQPFGAYEIRRREDGCAIGGVNFHGPVDEDGAVTIGYGLVPAAQGRGYASEALREVLRFAKASGVARVDGDTEHHNVASQRVMAAAGMLLVAEDERLKHYRITWYDDDTRPWST